MTNPYSVRMHVRGAPAEFTIAAAAHPGYDDKYWRYLEDMRVEQGSASRIDSVRWRGGLHTNDRVLRVNGAVRTWPELRALLGSVQIGDTVRFDIVRQGRPITVTVTASGYEIATVRVDDAAGQREKPGASGPTGGADSNSEVYRARAVSDRSFGSTVRELAPHRSFDRRAAADP